MKSTLIALLLPGLALSAAIVAPPAPVSDAMTIPNLLAERAVSPNKTCGNSGPGGSTQGWTCPSDAACCSSYGFCGTGDEFCLTTGGCQTRFSNSSGACQAPRSGVTVSIDGTCGTVGVGKAGYRCPGTIATCCSASGYCGNTTDHCDVNLGCQATFGKCTGTRTTPRNILEVAREVLGV